MEKKPRPIKISVSMKPEEYAEAKAAADFKRIMLATYIRMVFFEALREGK